MNDFIMYDEEIVKNLKRIKELLLDKKTKTRFDHVRGNVENKEIMIEAIDKAINIIISLWWLRLSRDMKSLTMKGSSWVLARLARRIVSF